MKKMLSLQHAKGNSFRTKSKDHDCGVNNMNMGTHGRPEVVMSAALPVRCAHERENTDIKWCLKVKHTACPRVLRTCIPILAIEAKCEEVKVGVESHTGR